MLGASGVFWPYRPIGVPAILPFMPYVVEYANGVGAGRFPVDGVDFHDALVKAQEAVRGLDCRSAALLYSPDPLQVFGHGAVLAAYTPAAGWMTDRALE